MMKFKEKLVEILTQAASIAIGLILFVAFVIGVPLAMFSMAVLVVLCRYVLIWHQEVLRMGLMVGLALGLLAFFVFVFHSVLSASKKENENKGGDS